jgi:hypothetical protein
MNINASVDIPNQRPSSQAQSDDLRVAYYIQDYMSRHLKVYSSDDFGTHTLKFLIMDNQGLALISTGENTSSKFKSYLKRFFSQPAFKAPLKEGYKLGETITIQVNLQHN